MTAQLIVTGDDFGISPTVNAAIVRAHTEGILTSASLMVTAPFADQAVALARENPSLAVGLHLVLADGLAASAPATIDRLVDLQGRFPKDPAVAGLRYFFDRRAHRQLEREIGAQLERFRATGLPLTHVDGHHHLHLHPTVLPRLAPLARRYGARGIRLVREDLSVAAPFGGPPQWTMLGSLLVFRLLSGNAARHTAGLATTDRVFGLLQTGRVSEAYVCRLIDEGRFSSAELYSHPGAAAASAAGLTPPGAPAPAAAAAESGSAVPRTAGPGTTEPPPDDDLWALVSPRVRSALERRGITLSSYAGPSEPGRVPRHRGRTTRTAAHPPAPPGPSS